MKRTYTILVFGQDEIPEVICVNHFATLKNKLIEMGVRPHKKDLLAGRLIHQDGEGNNIAVFASAPMGLESRHEIKPAVYISGADDHGGKKLPLNGVSDE